MEIKKILGYYWPHIKKYKKWYIVSLIAFALSSIIGAILTPIIYKQIFDLIASGGSSSILASQLMWLILLAAIFMFVAKVGDAIGEYTYQFHQIKVRKSLYDDAFLRVQRHSIEFFANNFTGSLVAKMQRLNTSLGSAQGIVTFHLFLNGIILLSTFLVLLYFSPVLALVFVIWVILFVFASVLFLKPISERDKIRAAARSNVTAVLADSITNTSTIKMFANILNEAKVFEKTTINEKNAHNNSWMLHNHLRLFQGFAVGVAEVGSLYVAIVLWTAGSISIGTIILMQIYLFKVFDIVWGLGRQMAELVSSFADAEEIIDIFNTPIGVQDIAKPEKCKIKEGAVEVKNIDFSYHTNTNDEDEVGGNERGDEANGQGGSLTTSDHGLFNNFTLSVKSGEKIGLVGQSGSGKTTITKLLLRFMDVDSGEILIDGQDIAKISQDDLRRNISYVPQDPILFHRSLRENIAYGKSDATESEIVEAAKAANAHDFISGLPEGYDTLVGERGIKLSGGERQRVAIARAMLKDAPILILDEATSALDSLSERHIQEAFARLMEGRTTLAIAHRLSTVQKMDRIVVFNKGTIVEQGTHSELAEDNGVYAELWKEQSSGFVK